MLNTTRNTCNLFKLLLFITVFLFVNKAISQEWSLEDKWTVFPVQPINFGVFYSVGAGTITVDYQGNVHVTGGVVSLDRSAVTPAVFELKFPHGSTVTIDYCYSVMLDGSKGGKLALIIGPTEKGESGDEFIINTTSNTFTQFRVGATLVIPAYSVSSVYSGSFPMTFKRE
ncbi:MAG: DUF4402 domain-containing protein [Flavobacteriaceae bacterium]|nr:DUF4402 domain-containing protein [Flavobacteriaceae bacterium]